MRVGLFGGSFDPIHSGHVKLATAALRQLRLDRVYLVVSPRSPFKTDQKKAPAADRLSLVRRAIAGKKGLVAVDWEFRRRGPSFTITTLRAYRTRHPNDTLYLILGTDALEGFSRWHRPGQIVGLSTLVVGRRPGARWTSLPKTLAADYVRLRGTFPDLSSTEIRAKLRAGRRPPGVSPDVYREIRRRKLYR